MAYNSVYITAGDYIYYYDTSVGFIDSYEWDIRGGTPTGGTSSNITSQYTIQNTSGYGVGLSVTDQAGVTDSVFVSGFVQVLPEIENLSLVALNSSNDPVGTNNANVIDMSQDIKYQATGTIRTAPTGSYYYQFIIPGTGGTVGFTGTSSQSISVTKNIYSWIDLTGSEVGSTYIGYNGVAQLNITTPVGNSYSASANVLYNKSGISDFVNITNYPTVTGPTAHNTTQYLCNIVNLPAYSGPNDENFTRTSSLGLAGNGPIIYVYLPTSTLNNLSFHGHGELTTLYTPFFEFSFSGWAPGTLGGTLIASGSIINSIESSILLGNTDFQILVRNYFGGYTSISTSTSPSGPSWALVNSGSGNINSISRYSQGNYMFPGDIYSTVLGYKFYYADTSSQLQPYYDGGFYSETAGASGKTWSGRSISAYMTDSSFGCVTSRLNEVQKSFLGGLTPAASLILNGGESFIDTVNDLFGNGFPCRIGGVLPSGKWASSDIQMTFNFFCDPNRNIATATLKGSVTVTIGASGATGNSYNGNLIYANSRWFDSTFPASHGVTAGFVPVINNSMSSNNLSPYFGATSGSVYQWRDSVYYVDSDPPNLNFDPLSDYVQGVKFSIYDDYITSSKGTRPFGLTADTYLVKVTISDNSSSWFSGTGGAKYTALQWLGISQNFIVNPYHYAEGATGPRIGWKIHG